MDRNTVVMPEIWFNYAVAGIPSTMLSLTGGAVTVTAELVREEVHAQTKH
jgi:hypothetical protein